MNPEQTFDLLTQHIAPRDGRTVGKVDVTVWHADIGDLSFDDACTAVATHFRESDAWLMPKHVRAEVRRIRDERIAAGPIPDPGTDDPAEYIRRLKASTKAIADGTMPPLAIEAGEGAEGWDNPTVRRIRELFEAEQSAARARRDAERKAEREATRAYIDAQETLLALDDLGKAAMAKAFEELFGEEQAALGFPLAAGAPGMTDQQKIVTRAARPAGGR